MTTISASSVTPTTISLKWDEMTNTNQTGGDPISFYSVEWLNSDTNLWIVLNVGGALATTYDHVYTSPPFPAGSTQQYRVRPKNGVGYGLLYSNTLSVLCDDVPSEAPLAIIALV
jgi:hypothetical protein